MLHIFPQPTYHASARICGSQEAIRRLGEALISASKTSQGESPFEIEMMASDGEGYMVSIQTMSDQQMDAGPRPYAQLGQSWDP